MSSLFFLFANYVFILLKSKSLKVSYDGICKG